MATKDSILRILLQVSKTGDGDKQAYKDLQNINTALKETTGINLNSITAWSAVGAGIGFVVGLGKKLIDYYKEGTEKLLTYNDATEKYAMTTGLSSEKAQIFVLMTERLGMSAEATAKAFNILTRHGIEPTADNLALLADEYNALEGPVEKANFVQEKFGKGGAEVVKILELEGSGVKSLCNDLQEFNALTQTQLNQAELLDLVQNKRKSTEDSLQKQIASQTVPAQIRYNLEVNKSAENNIALVKAQAALVQKVKDHQMSLQALLFPQEQAIINGGLQNNIFRDQDPLLNKVNQLLANHAIALFNADMTGVRMGNDFVMVASSTDGLGDSAEEAAAKIKLGWDATTGFKTALEQLNDIDLNFGDKVAEEIEKMKAKKLGADFGAQFNDEVMWAISSGTITEEQGMEYFKGLFAANQKMQIELGNIKPWQAAREFAELFNIPIQEAYDTIMGVKSTLEAINNLHYKIFLDIFTQNYGNTGKSNPGYGVTILPTASGGNLAEGNLVGEEGYEAVLKDREGNYVVVPHDMTKFLLGHGLLDVAGAYAGGGTIYSEDSMYSGKTKSGGSAAAKAALGSYGGSYFSPTGSGRTPVLPGGLSASAAAVAAQSSQAAAEAASETVAPVVTQAVQSFQHSQQVNSAQVAQQTQQAAQNSQNLINEIRGMRSDISALPEQLASEIQKRR